VVIGVGAFLLFVGKTVGSAQELPTGEHWYYRLDRETHRKCWYMRAFGEERVGRSIVESDLRLSEPASPDSSIRLGLGVDRL
jgi:hypothetical protein